MSIAILGTGSVGTALAAALSSAGHTVLRGSRNPDAAAGTVSHADAVKNADVIIAALHGQAVIPSLEQLGQKALAGKVILDVSNAFTPQFTLEHPGESVAGRIQEKFPAARVVKSLNTMNVAVMVDPHGTAPGSTVFVSGDDADAKQIVSSLLKDLGWAHDSILDLGGIPTATGAENYALLWVALMGALGTPQFNIAVVR
jgi:8-hydroxy-5-deazaflavin:NADPH oxidoreductase